MVLNTLKMVTESLPGCWTPWRWGRSHSRIVEHPEIEEGVTPMVLNTMKMRTESLPWC